MEFFNIIISIGKLDSQIVPFKARFEGHKKRLNGVHLNRQVSHLQIIIKLECIYPYILENR